LGGVGERGKKIDQKGMEKLMMRSDVILGRRWVRAGTRRREKGKQGVATLQRKKNREKKEYKARTEKRVSACLAEGEQERRRGILFSYRQKEINGGERVIRVNGE